MLVNANNIHIAIYRCIQGIPYGIHFKGPDPLGQND